jgi:tol-pal system protein YbgF
MRRLVLALALALMPLTGAALAGDKAQTLADIKLELDQLMAQFTQLKRELVTTGATTSAAGGGDALQRMDAIEAELTRLTAKTEDIDLQLKKVVADGTNRIGDIEFRLCEQTPGCDPTTLPATPELGADATPPADATATPTLPADGTVPTTTPPATTTTTQDGGDLAVNEKADFDRAKGVLATGDFRTAADLFATFAQTYTGGELTQTALVLRGDALDKLGDTANSARSYLQAFSGAPTGPVAGEALTKLGQQLGKLGQKPEACATLAEVGKRFPGTPDDGNAKAAMAALGCT